MSLVNYCHHDYVPAPGLENVFSIHDGRRRFRVCLKCYAVEETQSPAPREELLTQKPERRNAA